MESKGGAKRVREACVEGLEQSLPTIVAMAKGEDDKATAASRVAAFDKLAKYGIGTRVTVEIVGEDMVDVFAHVLQDRFGFTDERIDRFSECIREELAKFEQGETEEKGEADAE